MTLSNTLSLLFSSFFSGLLIDFLDVQERKKDDALCLASLALVVSQLRESHQLHFQADNKYDRLKQEVTMDATLNTVLVHPNHITLNMIDILMGM